MQFVIYDVAGFCPWETGEITELRRQNRWYGRRWHWRVWNWRRVAEESVRAVEDHAGDWTLEDWCAWGERAGLRGASQNAFASLFLHPIMVSPAQWTNGRHRGLLMQRAHATRVAVVDPDWVPSWE